jgi:hypothetical protein
LLLLLLKLVFVSIKCPGICRGRLHIGEDVRRRLWGVGITGRRVEGRGAVLRIRIAGDPVYVFTLLTSFLFIYCSTKIEDSFRYCKLFELDMYGDLILLY